MIPRRVHLVGIGGIGMSAIARILQARGHLVSGSDLKDSPLLEELEGAGMRIFRGHAAGQVGDAEMVIISSAVPPRNPEVQEALRRGIQVAKRAEILGDLVAGRKAIAVAGTHGKTTTTSMIALTLLLAGLDPSFVVGGVVQGLGTNARHGRGDYFVIEADEYDRMFLGLQPELAVITHVEWDHPDCYPTPEDLLAAFQQFVAQMPPEGCVIACGDHEGAARLVAPRRNGGPRGMRETHGLSYGLGPDADLQAVDIVEERDRSRFQALWMGRPLGWFEVQVPGRHNVANALAALAVAGRLGVPWERAREALTRFRGVERRFQVRGSQRGVVVVDDYAHHPTEIRAALSAARQAYPGQRVWAVFQPHTFSRIEALREGFAQSLSLADEVIVLPVFPAREEGDPIAAARHLAEMVPGREVVFAETLEGAACLILSQVQPGDVVLTLAAGDGNRVGEMVLAGLHVAGGQSGESREFGG
ncbi:MAG: UDP-N-acetylmuramate--L-alanine ligase [Anaerolineae bacterium]